MIDCGPDFRQQMLTCRCQKIDAILFTHEHADHTAGLDDIRPFFFKQGDIPIYAHSDWLELLYDHGILGIVLYSFICLTLITQKNNIKFYAPDLYWPYLMTMVIFFIKSIYSGIYINKDSIVLIMTIAFILGTANQNQSRINLQDTNG